VVDGRRVKTLALIVRKPGTTRAEFREHYERLHAPLALGVMGGLVRYVRHHVEEELYGAGGFDVATCFTYRDEAALRCVIARLATPAGDAVRRDELRFMDKPRNRFFAVRALAEHGTRAPASGLQALALVRRAVGQGAADFAAGFSARALPALRDAVRGLRWVLHDEALPTFGEPPWDAAIQLHATGDVALAAWCAERERAGERAVAVRVSDWETALPVGGVP
jgi:uncharacterized protein (TIGR02118 family)